MYKTLFSSEAIIGALIGATVTLLGLLINTFMELRKEVRQERSSRFAKVRRELGLDKGIQGSEVTLFINSERTWWSRFLLLFGVVLHHPDLSMANLMRVNFAGADLRGVNFSYANLTETDFSGANLKYVNFRGAILIKTNFFGAKFGDTNFWEAIVFQSTGIDKSANIVGITDIDRLEQRFGQKILSPDDLGQLLSSLGVDIRSLPIREIYWEFKAGR